jgi:hypothetical protein
MLVIAKKYPVGRACFCWFLVPPSLARGHLGIMLLIDLVAVQLVGRRLAVRQSQDNLVGQRDPNRAPGSGQKREGIPRVRWNMPEGRHRAARSELPARLDATVQLNRVQNQDLHTWYKYPSPESRQAGSSAVAAADLVLNLCTQLEN